MSRKSRTRIEDRRKFLKDLSLASGAAALVAVTGQSAAATPEEDPAPAATENRGYHETPHIQTYYRKARL